MSAVPSLTAMLQQLVSTASISSTRPEWDSGNRAVIDLLASWLETLGFAVEIMPLPQNPAKANLIATLGSGPGGLVLSGHTDTVPYDAGRWQYDPLKLTEADQRFYGLGSTDMKGFFPIAIEAAKAFLEQPLQQPLIILATADEESSMDGARALLQAGRPKARYAVIGEPTNLQPVRMHKGMMMEAITIRGRSGHSSNPALGNSALEAMHVVIAELLQYRQHIQQQYQHSLFAVPTPTINLGCIHGGDSVNRICGQCELEFDLRPLPGMELDVLRQHIQQRLQPIAEQRQIDIHLRPLMTGVDAFEEPADSPWIDTLQQLSGATASAVNFATEAPFLQQLGMQTIVMGPGSIDCAHQPDEYLPLAQIEPAVDILQQLIDRCCRQANLC